MSVLRQSFSRALAGSMLIAATACQEATRPEAPSITDGSSAEIARKAPPPPSSSFNLRVTGNTSWSASFAWDAKTGTASYRLRDNWGREISVPGTQTSVTWRYPHPNLQAGATYSF